MERDECIKIFNDKIRNVPLSLDKQVIPLVLDYLTEINYEKINEMISLIGQNPQIAGNFFPEMIDYYCKKFNIIKVMKKDKFNNFNLIMFYGG